MYVVHSNGSLTRSGNDSDGSRQVHGTEEAAGNVTCPPQVAGHNFPSTKIGKIHPGLQEKDMLNPNE